MILQFHKGPDVPYRVRPRYRREDYLVDPIRRGLRVDVEVTQSGLGEVVPVDPLISYNLALEADGKRPYPVIYE